MQQSWAGPLFPSSSPSPSSPPSPSSISRSLHVHLLSGEDAEAPSLAAAAAVAAAARREDREDEERKGRERAAAAGKDGAKDPHPPPPPPPSREDEEEEEEEEAEARRREKTSSSSSSSSSAAALDAALAATRFGPPSAARPQVCLCYGGHFSLAGFPAWGLAQAEVYSMGPLAEATRAGVEEAAARFVGTAQRFGR